MASTNVGAIVEARAVAKRFGDRAAVDGLDLDVPAGVCFGLLGPNGAGKTTTLRMIYGVARPTAGTIRVFGIDVSATPRAVRARLGVTLQDTILLESATARENLRIFGRFHLLSEAMIALRIDEIAAALELGATLDRPVRTLSGGFRRRLAIAMSLMNRPELLILDEPTTGLDPAVRHALWSRVRALRAEGTTVLLTTHYMDEAERLCDTVVIMSQGRAACRGTPRALVAEYLAQEAVELDCTEDEERRILAGANIKRLRAGDRLMLFADDASPLVDLVHRTDGGDRRPIVVRPANLEDVFLSVTGTRLEEDANEGRGAAWRGAI
jgi:lipooligosaccharide transport system ATP-binding protein